MAESITQNTAYRAVMELKTYTITIRSGKSSGESKTYTVSHGSSWSFPSCPFSPDSGKAFKDYTLNGSTYSAGSSVTVTSDISITCNWVLTNPVGKSLQVRYFVSTDIGFAYELVSYDPELEGFVFKFSLDAKWDIIYESNLVIAKENLNSRQFVADLGYMTEWSPVYGQISQTTNFDGRPYITLHTTSDGQTGSGGRLATVTYTNS